MDVAINKRWLFELAPLDPRRLGRRQRGSRSASRGKRQKGVAADPASNLRAGETKSSTAGSARNGASVIEAPLFGPAVQPRWQVNNLAWVRSMNSAPLARPLGVVGHLRAAAVVSPVRSQRFLAKVAQSQRKVAIGGLCRCGSQGLLISGSQVRALVRPPPFQTLSSPLSSREKQRSSALGSERYGTS